MPRLKVRFIINPGRHGAPMTKLGRISEQAEKFLRSLAADCEIDARPGEWLAMNFKDGSVEYDAEFQGDLRPGAAEIFVRNLELLADYDPDVEGLNVGITPATTLEYARIGGFIDPDETVGIGIYPVRGGKPKLRSITYSRAARLRRDLEAPLSSYGTIQGIMYTWQMGAREPNFQIRELSTDDPVKIFYPASMYSDVAQAVQERTTMLLVSGNISYDRASKAVIEMRADRLERMRMLSGEEFEAFFGSAPDFELIDEIVDV